MKVLTLPPAPRTGRCESCSLAEAQLLVAVGDARPFAVCARCAVVAA